MKNHDKLYPKPALKYQRGDNIGQGAHRKRQRKTTWRRLWIMPYTAIAQLGSSPGKTSSDVKIVLIRAEYFFKDQRTPPTWAFCLGVKEMGKGLPGQGTLEVVKFPPVRGVPQSDEGRLP